MFNSKQVLAKNIFHSIRLVVIKGFYCEKGDIIEVNMKYLVKSDYSLPQAFFVEYCHNRQELAMYINIMLDVSKENSPEQANVFEQGKTSFAQWLSENSDNKNADCSPWMFTSINHL